MTLISKKTFNIFVFSFITYYFSNCTKIVCHGSIAVPWGQLGFVTPCIAWNVFLFQIVRVWYVELCRAYKPSFILYIALYCMQLLTF